MARGFLSGQLIAAETELAWIAKHADYLGFDLGDHADAIHWDKALAQDVESAIETAVEIAKRARHVEGLLRAYEIHRTKGGKRDDAGAR